MKIYATIGTSNQTIVSDTVQYTPLDNEILMGEERPEGDYIANENGQWVLDFSKQIKELDNRYKKEKAVLCEQYTDAQIHGDTEIAEEIVDEMIALDNWYDTQYEKIINGDE